MRISDWSSDVCSSDLHRGQRADPRLAGEARYLCPSRPPGCRSPGLAANAPAPARRGAGEADPRRQPQSGQGPGNAVAEIGRAHVCTPVTHAQLVCRLLLETLKYIKIAEGHTDK